MWSPAVIFAGLLKPVKCFTKRLEPTSLFAIGNEVGSNSLFFFFRGMGSLAGGVCKTPMPLRGWGSLRFVEILLLVATAQSCCFFCPNPTHTLAFKLLRNLKTKVVRVTSLSNFRSCTMSTSEQNLLGPGSHSLFNKR